MKSWMIVILLVACMPFASASSFEDANRKFEAGDFAGAAEAYENLIESEGPRAALFYNLGNSYQKLGKLGPSILAYERARLLTPRDPDLHANLTLARKAAAAFEEPGIDPRLHAVLHFLSRNEWSWLAAGSALFLGAAVFILGLTRPPSRGTRQMVVASCSVAGFVMVAASVALAMRRGEAERGVVLSENATVRLSPFASAEALGTPGPGRMVKLGDETAGFRYVEVPGTSLRGWLAREDVATLLP
jgi:hypothetical protein